MSAEIRPDKSIDCKGLCCPLPVLETKKAIDKLKIGQILEILSTDEGSKRDIPAWAKRAGHELLDMKEGEVFKIYIRKGK